MKVCKGFKLGLLSLQNASISHVSIQQYVLYRVYKSLIDGILHRNGVVYTVFSFCMG